MSIHTIREVINYVPEAYDMMKQAHVEKEFPTNSKDSTAMSALEIEYLTKVAQQRVAEDIVDRVNTAVELYGIKDDITKLAKTMVNRVNEKQASEVDYEQEVRMAEEYVESQCSGLFDLEKVASTSENLYDEYSDYVESDTVKRYAGAGKLIKEAAELALVSRYKNSGNDEFMKIARLIHNTDVNKLDTEDNRAIAQQVSQLDKQAGLYGYDFYKDAFLVKEADLASSLQVQLAGKKIPVEKIITTAPSLSGAIGEDVAQQLTGDPEEVKAIAESLPLDLQKIIVKYS